MNAESAPLPAPEDLAMERLVAAVQSAIGVVQEHLANLAADGQDAKWSVSDGDAKASLATGARLLQLRNQLQGEPPRTIFACWVDDRLGSHVAVPVQRNIGNTNIGNYHDAGQPEPDTRVETYIDARTFAVNYRNANYRNKGARK